MLIVTGGAGFIGSALIWKLNQQGIDDILVVDRLHTSDKWRNLSYVSYADYMQKDEFLARLIAQPHAFRPTAVVHLGACSSTTERDSDYLMANNFHYTRTLAEWCLARGIRFIYASSAATYGAGEHGYTDDDHTTRLLRPMNPYGYSKQVFDLWALKTGALRSIVGLKFFNVFGPNEYHKDSMTSMVYRAFQQITATGRVSLFKSCRDDYADGGQQRDFVYVKDCVETIGWLLQQSVGGLFNVGSGQARTWNDLANAVFHAMGREPQIDYIDMPLALRRHYQYYTQADMTRLRATGCPKESHTLEAAIHDYVTNYLQREPAYLCSAGQ